MANNYRFKEFREKTETDSKPMMTALKLSEEFKVKGYYLSRNRITALENKSDVVPNRDDLKAYCEYFHTTSDYLLGFTSIPSRKNEDLEMIERITGLSYSSIKSLKILKRSNDIDILNFIMNDYFSFLSNINLYLNNKFDTPVHFDEHLGIFVESKDVSDNSILMRGKERYIGIGKKLDYEIAGQAAFETLCVPVSILETHALHCIQRSLDDWKKLYKERNETT